MAPHTLRGQNLDAQIRIFGVVVNNWPRLQDAAPAFPDTDQLVSQSTPNPTGVSFDAKGCLPCANASTPATISDRWLCIVDELGLTSKAASGRNRKKKIKFTHQLQITSNQKEWELKLKRYCLRPRQSRRACAGARGGHGASCSFSIKALWGSATRTEVETSKLGSLMIMAACVTPWLPTTSFSDLKQPVQSGNDDCGVTQWWWARSAAPPPRPGHTSLKIIELKAAGVVKYPNWQQHSSYSNIIGGN